jgi:putative colanic acid biosynthesis acetyltransferase WcaF
MNSFPSPHSVRNRALRAAWLCTYSVLFRPTPKLLHGWRRSLLRLFGAQIGIGAHPYPSCKIWAPWNLAMGNYSCLGPYVDCYNVARIELGEYATVSQYAYLCGATHDYTRLTMPLVPKPIRIGARVWVAAAVFVGPGVTVEEGAVVGARSCVVRDVPAWTVVAGNPARVIKRRVLLDTKSDRDGVESPVA